MLLKIFEKLSEVSDRTSRIETRCSVMEEDIRHIKAEDAEQNRLLAEHIQGVKQNAQRLTLEQEARRAHDQKLDLKLKAQDERLKSIEVVPKFFQVLKTVALYVTTIGGAVAIVTKLMHLW